MYEYENILLLITLTWLWTHFTPIQDLLDRLFEKLQDTWLVDIVYQVIGCWYCLTLWTGLIFLKPQEAVLASMITYILTKWTKK